MARNVLAAVALYCQKKVKLVIVKNIIICLLTNTFLKVGKCWSSWTLWRSWLLLYARLFCDQRKYEGGWHKYWPADV